MAPVPTAELDARLSRLAEDERHFHTIQAGLRGLASTWMLAAFASVAVLLKQEKDVTWLFPPFALVVLVSLMANVGLALLWVIDQLVYQRLFNASYIAGLRLEQSFPIIPPVRAIQRLSTGGKDSEQGKDNEQGKSIAYWVKFFYIWPMAFFSAMALAAAGILTFSAAMSTPTVGSSGYILDILALLSVVPGVWVVYRARGVSFFLFAAALPEDYSRILGVSNCEEIIRSHIQSLPAVDLAVEKPEPKRHGRTETRPN